MNVVYALLIAIAFSVLLKLLRMQLERYAFEANEDFMSFNFCSNGPKGVIRKIVKYDEMPSWRGLRIYNVSFGDEIETSARPDDSVVSNNGDRDKILATVAATILEFKERYGELAIYARGFTPARTRLYQIGINANLADIEKVFTVYGINQGKIESFITGVNYEAFLVIKK